jgi:hypothetical protein
VFVQHAAWILHVGDVRADLSGQLARIHCATSRAAAYSAT